MRGDRNEPFDYVRQFDSAIDAVITAQPVTDLPKRLAVAVAFSSTLRGESYSYRKALKKYSNSIVFSDLGIYLLLVCDDLSVQVINPGEVNEFLRNLNRYIANSK